MKLLLIYPPFCTPSTMPYSISYLKSFIKNNSNIQVKCLDLNAKFNKTKFPEPYKIKDPTKALELFNKISMDVYQKNNKLVLIKKDPELLNEMIKLIEKEQPDYVAFSMVYNSQCFYTQALIEKLHSKYKILVGGPAVHHSILDKSTFLADEHQLLKHLDKEATTKNISTIPDFSDFDKEDYLTKEIVLPLRTSFSCYYKQCAFCTHHKSQNYRELPMNEIKEAIMKNKINHVYFFDDMISKKRLLELSETLKPLNIKWWCQLKPTKDLIEIFPQLYDSGLRSVSWGVESANQRILNLMTKGTNVEDISKVLEASHKAKIINLIYFILGFPSETKEELMDTVKFIEKNKEYIDLVSTSLFGLQRGSKIFENPKAYEISEVIVKKRTILDERILYKVKSGLQSSEVRLLRRKLSKQLHQADKISEVYNFFKEQTIFLQNT